MKKHPYLKQEDFADPVFLKVRRHVWLILLPYCTGKQRTETERLIAIYDEMLK